MEKYHVYKIAPNKTIDFGGGYEWSDVKSITKGYALHEWVGERWLCFTRSNSKWSIWVERER